MPPTGLLPSLQKTLTLTLTLTDRLQVHENREKNRFRFLTHRFHHPRPCLQFQLQPRLLRLQVWLLQPWLQLQLQPFQLQPRLPRLLR